MQYMSDAFSKNQTAIQKNYSTQKRREEDSAKMEIQGSLYVNVQQELKKKCPKFVLFERKTHSYRSAGRAGQSMETKNYN